MKKSSQMNIHGRPLELCSQDPLTGFFRNGCCDTDNHDRGLHTVCVILTDEFLKFSLEVGNDLSTPRPEFDFPGLKPGQKWCLCANRWLEAYESGVAPPIITESTNIKTLDIIDFETIALYSLN
ncbi:DUF2237 domain-containing protein [Hyphomicrobiales bacterium]|jgi:uncharacterized protein (DUF2237 family)|nr:DUF2237 domain-containing protein [Hyphomicrobiales bacterium]MDG1152426.1 DUF2237 domain-containing protein [Hyphomicrobiales bacterium]MDG1665248.1 DUF2237 domain-containing protein [Hyphomicrobiales bacterium]MDG2413367.1 DUF2237 domain-containing protein [Hyphomicrobiales bacterium]|tara:strand:- start:330 stop:701 length:372 start_codon:yes stop_codon:yes gene_type:complete